jgi:hypothetical protein
MDGYDGRRSVCGTSLAARPLCCGHDLTTIFGIGLQRILGSQKAILVARDVVESLMRLAFGLEELRLTSMFQEIRRWEWQTLHENV